jgi:hypothetical protein
MAITLTVIYRYKYTPDSLRHALYPSAPSSKVNSSADRPKKRRKVDRHSPMERNEKEARQLEVETVTGEKLAFTPDLESSSNGAGAKNQRRWSLVKVPQLISQSNAGRNTPLTNGTSASTPMEVDPLIFKQNITFTEIDFLSDSICIWDPYIQDTDFPSWATPVNHEERGKGLSMPVRIWRWKQLSRTSDAKLEN